MKIKGWNLFEIVWLALFSIIMLALSYFWKSSILGITVFLTGVMCVVLVAKGNIWNYAFGIYNSIGYAWLSYQNNLNGEVMLNIFFLRVTAEQMVEIARGHIEREDKLVYDANRYLFVDTNAITTYMFGMDYQGYVLPELETMALKAQSRYDLYFLCCDDIPYDDTWDRSGNQKRQIFQKQIVADLKERKLPYVELRGNLDERIAVVERVLENFKKYSNSAYLSMLSGVLR